MTAGLIALVYAIVKAQEKGWGSLHTIGIGALSIGLLVAFVLIERRSAEPLVRLSIFSVPTIRAANVVMLLVGSGIFAMFFFMILWMQVVNGWSPVKAGMALSQQAK